MDVLSPVKPKEEHSDHLVRPSRSSPEQEQGLDEEAEDQRVEAERYYREQDELVAQIPLLTEAVALRRDVEIVKVESFSDLDGLGTRKVELKDLADL
ncbi:MAG: hypothetical protein Q9169_003951 [Polycauliona sp. 2 TL-2023]